MIILASNSPRRKELLKDCGFPFEIHSARTREHFDTTIAKEKAIEQIAFEKADTIFRQYPDAIVIGADTMVCCQHNMLGKPKDEEDARKMLTLLSGKYHEVITGVAILCKMQQIIFHETTRVEFHELDSELIKWYLDSKEPFDKAGAYGIQDKGKLLVKGISGDYYNVMGLPIARIYREIKKLQNL